jgi:hypothetical protein
MQNSVKSTVFNRKFKLGLCFLGIFDLRLWAHNWRHLIIDTTPISGCFNLFFADRKYIL